MRDLSDCFDPHLPAADRKAAYQQRVQAILANPTMTARWEGFDALGRDTGQVLQALPQEHALAVGDVFEDADATLIFFHVAHHVDYDWLSDWRRQVLQQPAIAQAPWPFVRAMHELPEGILQLLGQRELAATYAPQAFHAVCKALDTERPELAGQRWAAQDDTQFFPVKVLLDLDQLRTSMSDQRKHVAAIELMAACFSNDASHKTSFIAFLQSALLARTLRQREYSFSRLGQDADARSPDALMAQIGAGFLVELLRTFSDGDRRAGMEALQTELGVGTAFWEDALQLLQAAQTKVQAMPGSHMLVGEEDLGFVQSVIAAQQLEQALDAAAASPSSARRPRM